MRVLAWRPRSANAVNPTVPGMKRLSGSYAGRATFRPRYPDMVPPTLKRAIGKMVELGYVGIAPRDDRFAGQALFLEWMRDEEMDGFLIPEQDLEFSDSEGRHPPQRPWEWIRKD